jgi:hypothetical protein
LFLLLIFVVDIVKMEEVMCIMYLKMVLYKTNINIFFSFLIFKTKTLHRPISYTTLILLISSLIKELITIVLWIMCTLNARTFSANILPFRFFFKSSLSRFACLNLLFNKKVYWFNKSAKPPSIWTRMMKWIEKIDI